MATKSKGKIREEAYEDSNYYVNSEGKAPKWDISEGWQPYYETFAAFAEEEIGKAKETWYQMDADRPTRHCAEWMALMWMWARRVRRDLLVLEKYLEDQKAAGNLTGEIPFYADPGDPPPPPEESFS